MDKDEAYKFTIIWAEYDSEYEEKPLSWWESIYDSPGERETAIDYLIAYGEYEDLDGNLTRTEDPEGLREVARVLWDYESQATSRESEA